MNTLLQELKRNNPDLKEAEILGILYILLNTTNLTNTDLLRYTGLPKQTLRDFKSSISKLLQVVDGSDEILLTVESSKIISALSPVPYKWRLVTYDNLEITKMLDDIRKEFNLEPKRELDQFFATSPTSVSKAQILVDKGLVAGKNIALLGDDDLVSVALSLLNKSFTKLTVFDIDPQLLSTIEAICIKLNINNVQTRLYDVRNNIDKSDLAKYDLVVMDPPYTNSGVSLFLNRGIDLLTPHTDFSGKYIFLFYGNSFKSPEKSLKIQHTINRYNLLIEEKVDKFATYFGAESIGSSSSLYILKQTPATDSANVVIKSGIYTNESEKESKFPFVGNIVVQLWDIDAATLNSKGKTLSALEFVCKKHKLAVTDTKVTQSLDSDSIYTLILKESSLIAHVWPDLSLLQVNLVSSKPIYERAHLGSTLARTFNTQRYDVQILE